MDDEAWVRDTLTRAGWPELIAMTVAGVAGGVSLLGVVAVAVLVVTAAFLAVAAAPRLAAGALPVVTVVDWANAGQANARTATPASKMRFIAKAPVWETGLRADKK